MRINKKMYNDLLKRLSDDEEEIKKLKSPKYVIIKDMFTNKEYGLVAFEDKLYFINRGVTLFSSSSSLDFDFKNIEGIEELPENLKD